MLLFRIVVYARLILFLGGRNNVAPGCRNRRWLCGQNLDLSSAKRTNHYSLINSRVSSETLSTATQPDLKSAIANRQSPGTQQRCAISSAIALAIAHGC